MNLNDLFFILVKGFPFIVDIILFVLSILCHILLWQPSLSIYTDSFLILHMYFMGMDDSEMELFI